MRLMFSLVLMGLLSSTCLKAMDTRNRRKSVIGFFDSAEGELSDSEDDSGATQLPSPQVGASAESGALLKQVFLQVPIQLTATEAIFPSSKSSYRAMPRDSESSSNSYEETEQRWPTKTSLAGKKISLDAIPDYPDMNELLQIGIARNKPYLVVSALNAGADPKAYRQTIFALCGIPLVEVDFEKEFFEGKKIVSLCAILRKYHICKCNQLREEKRKQYTTNRYEINQLIEDAYKKTGKGSKRKKKKYKEY